MALASGGQGCHPLGTDLKGGGDGGQVMVTEIQRDSRGLRGKKAGEREIHALVIGSSVCVESQHLKTAHRFPPVFSPLDSTGLPLHWLSGCSVSVYLYSTTTLLVKLSVIVMNV